MSKYEELGLTSQTKKIIKEQLTRPISEVYSYDEDIAKKIEKLRKIIINEN